MVSGGVADMVTREDMREEAHGRQSPGARSLRWQFLVFLRDSELGSAARPGGGGGEVVAAGRLWHLRK